MRRTVVSLAAVALLSAALCVFSSLYIGQISAEMEGMRTDVLRLADSGETDDAHLRLQQMAEVWSGYEPLLETIARHDDLHEITVLIIEADAHMESGDPDDFSRAMALLGHAIRHLAREEQLHIANLL